MPIGIPIKALEYPLGLLIIRLNHLYRISYQTQELVVTPISEVPGLVFPRAKMLDLLARVFDFGQAKCGGRAFEEMAEGGERCEVVFLSMRKGRTLGWSCGVVERGFEE